jgi:hypothetical protein
MGKVNQIQRWGKGSPDSGWPTETVGSEEGNNSVSEGRTINKQPCSSHIPTWLTYTPKMEAVWSSKTLAATYHNARCHNMNPQGPEHLELDFRRRNLTDRPTGQW